MSDCNCEDFIQVYDNVFPRRLCGQLIDIFENWAAAGYSYRRSIEERSLLKKEDIATNLLDVLDPVFEVPLRNRGRTIAMESLDYINRCYEDYCSTYPGTHIMPPRWVYSMKLQKTKVREGYHVWHYERAGRESSHKHAVFIVYLNDINDGGETEFLYQSKRVSPVAGRVVIWPAGFTHAHRGNPPLKEDKYVLTGWYEV